MPDISLTIVTPDGYKLKEVVSDFTAPSVDGEFGVLPGHRPLLAALRTGIVTIHAGGKESRFAVGPGFVQVADNHALVLTDRFAKKEDVDPVRVRLDLKDADTGLDHFSGDRESSEYHDLVALEQWAAVQLELYGDPPPPTVRTNSVLGVIPEDYQGVADDDGA